MDIVLATIGFLCVVVGVFGSFLPIVPGPGLSWVGLLLLYLTNAVPNSYWMLGITAGFVLLVTVLDYIIPAKGTKRYGGSKYGIWGTNIGLVVGILAPIPFGFLIGPFVGAFFGELIFNSSDHKRAFKAATGSFVGFLASTFIQFMICIIFLGIFITVAWQHRELF